MNLFWILQFIRSCQLQQYKYPEKDKHICTINIVSNVKKTLTKTKKEKKKEKTREKGKKERKEKKEKQ